MAIRGATEATATTSWRVGIRPLSFPALPLSYMSSGAVGLGIVAAEFTWSLVVVVMRVFVRTSVGGGSVLLQDSRRVILACVVMLSSGLRILLGRQAR